MATVENNENGTIAGFKFNRTNGGRVVLKGTTSGRGDCVVRALTIATDTPYTDIATEIVERQTAAGIRAPKNYMNGVSVDYYGPILRAAGFVWVKVGKRGSNFDRLNLKTNRTYVLHTYSHLTAVVNGTFHDTWDSRRNKHDGKSYHASTESFGDTSVPSTKRPKTITVWGYWVKKVDA